MTEDSKEEFCSACAVGISALVGAGMTGSSKAVKNKKKKKVVFYIGLTISIISILILIYLLTRNCDSCR